jgi:hypothetical protein
VRALGLRADTGRAVLFVVLVSDRQELQTRAGVITPSGGVGFFAIWPRMVETSGQLAEPGEPASGKFVGKRATGRLTARSAEPDGQNASGQCDVLTTV